MQQKEIDNKDNKIIQLLRDDARISYTEIGKIVGLTRPAVKNRIKNLEDSEVILGYKTIINEQKVCGNTLFLIQVDVKAEDFEHVKEILKKQVETVVLCQATGNYSLVAFCMSDSVENIKFFVNKIAKEVSGIISLKYNIVLDMIKGKITVED